MAATMLRPMLPLTLENTTLMISGSGGMPAGGPAGPPTGCVADCGVSAPFGPPEGCIARRFCEAARPFFNGGPNLSERRRRESCMYGMYMLNRRNRILPPCIVQYYLASPSIHCGIHVIKLVQFCKKTTRELQPLAPAPERSTLCDKYDHISLGSTAIPWQVTHLQDISIIVIILLILMSELLNAHSHLALFVLPTGAKHRWPSVQDQMRWQLVALMITKCLRAPTHHQGLHLLSWNCYYF